MLRAAFTSALPAYPQAAHRNRAWLSRDLPSTCPHAEHRWLVYAAGTLSTRPGALSSSRRTSSPQPDREIPRFSPVLARTLRPGRSTVPFADRVMFLMLRSSTRITSNRRAMPVDVFSHQSRRRSVSRAFRRATAVLALPRRADPRLARASLRWSMRSRVCSRAVRPGAVSICPVDRAALRYQVDLAVQGHNHVYERTNPLIYDAKTNSARSSKQAVAISPSEPAEVEPARDGTTYATVGTAGTPRYAWTGAHETDRNFKAGKGSGTTVAGDAKTQVGPYVNERDFSTTFESVDWSQARYADYGFIALDVSPAPHGRRTTMTLRFINEQGAELDRVVFSRTAGEVLPRG